MIKRVAISLGLIAGNIFCASAFAQTTIPSGASVQLNGGSLSLAGTSLLDAGVFGIGSGAMINILDASIAPGASLVVGTGAMTLSRDWSNLGTFTAGSGAINFIDGGVATSNISGNSIFNNASFISSTGKTYSFATGSTQTVGGALIILGASTLGIQFKSATLGQAANLNLLPGGTQNIDFVGVSSVHATGQPLAPTKTNFGGSGDALGWFGAVVAAVAAIPAPMLSMLGMLLLCAVLIAAFARHSRRVRSLTH